LRKENNGENSPQRESQDESFIDIFPKIEQKANVCLEAAKSQFYSLKYMKIDLTEINQHLVRRNA
jgi:hypothetical protein